MLAAALGEEMVSLTSSVVVEAIERDRDWVCEGEPLGMAARLGGTAEPGAVYRWVWLTARGEAELHPGPALQWRAPTKAGRYGVRFQVCKDLGGRRVGVLAERVAEIEVRPCAPGERQEAEALRLTVTQQGQGAYLFQAIAQGGERSEAYAWDFGDGERATTSEPRVEHTFPVRELGPQEVRSFTVRVQARRSRGGPLSAIAFVLARGSLPRMRCIRSSSRSPGGVPGPRAVFGARWWLAAPWGTSPGIASSVSLSSGMEAWTSLHVSGMRWSAWTKGSSTVASAAMSS